MNLSGTGLPPHHRGTVSLGSMHLGRFTTGRQGRWSTPVRVPRDAHAGVRRLQVRAGARFVTVGYPVTGSPGNGASETSIAILSTGESVRLSATRVTVGSSVRIAAAGFRHGSTVTVWLDRRHLSGWRVGRRGTVRTTLLIPSRTRAGAHTLSVRGDHHRLQLRLLVTGRPATAPAGGGPTGGSPSPAPVPVPVAAQSDPVVDAVGDMGCAFNDPNYNGGNGSPGVPAPGNDCLQGYVSDLVVSPLPNALLDLGDNQYDTGTLFDYQHVFDPTYGRANAVTYPTLGNAEYNDGNAPPTGFFSYFSAAGVFARIQATGGGNTSHLTTDGYYSFDLGTWHIIALNSNCTGTYAVSGGCQPGSPQEQWLKTDLAANHQKCILAFWHHPRWNSGALGNDSATAAFWTDLYNAHATLVINGHGNHHYERFVPQDPTGAPAADGIREFIVSTGGQSHGVPPTTPGDRATSQVANYTTFGILRLTLHPSSYDWQFVPATADGQSGRFTDSGSAPCS